MLNQGHKSQGSPKPLSPLPLLTAALQTGFLEVSQKSHSILQWGGAEAGWAKMSCLTQLLKAETWTSWVLLPSSRARMRASKIVQGASRVLLPPILPSRHLGPAPEGRLSLVSSEPKLYLGPLCHKQPVPCSTQIVQWSDELSACRGRVNPFEGRRHYTIFPPTEGVS